MQDVTIKITKKRYKKSDTFVVAKKYMKIYGAKGCTNMRLYMCTYS